MDRHTGHNNLQYTTTVRKATVYHSGRDATTRDVVFRDIKTTTVTQMRDVHIRDKTIKDCILLGSPFTVGTYSSRIVSCLHPVKDFPADDCLSYIPLPPLYTYNFVHLQRSLFTSN
jgi:hypothetical protein